MTIGNGIAIAGIWLGVGILGFSAFMTPIGMVGVAVCAALATLWTGPAK